MRTSLKVLAVLVVLFAGTIACVGSSDKPKSQSDFPVIVTLVSDIDAWRLPAGHWVEVKELAIRDGDIIFTAGINRNKPYYATYQSGHIPPSRTVLYGEGLIVAHGPDLYYLKFEDSAMYRYFVDT